MPDITIRDLFAAVAPSKPEPWHEFAPKKFEYKELTYNLVEPLKMITEAWLKNDIRSISTEYFHSYKESPNIHIVKRHCEESILRRAEIMHHFPKPIDIAKVIASRTIDTEINVLLDIADHLADQLIQWILNNRFEYESTWRYVWADKIIKNRRQ